MFGCLLVTIALTLGLYTCIGVASSTISTTNPAEELMEQKQVETTESDEESVHNEKVNSDIDTDKRIDASLGEDPETESTNGGDTPVSQEGDLSYWPHKRTEGNYGVVGVDMPAGVYKLIAHGTRTAISGEGGFLVSAREDTSWQGRKGDFDGKTYVEVEDGNVFVLMSHTTGLRLEDVEKRLLKTISGEDWFCVGVDCMPGTYKLSPIEGESIGGFTIYNSAAVFFRDVRDSQSFYWPAHDEDVYIDLNEGEFVVLNDSVATLVE